MTRVLAILLLRILLGVGALALMAYLFFLRDPYYTPVAEHPTRYAWPPQSSVKIAVPWPDDGRMSLIQGVKLSLKELNARGGPLAGKIEIEFIDEPGGKNGDGSIARRIAKDPEIVAVIGHESNASALVSAVTYEVNGILYLSPKATVPRLTEHGFRYIFRLVPDDREFAEALAEFAASRGWTRIGTVYGLFEQGEALARSFFLHAIARGIAVIDILSYLPREEFEKHDLRAMLAPLKSAPNDAILLADRLPWAAKVLKDMQELGFKSPILTGDTLDSSATWTLAGTAANNLYVASAVNPQSNEPAFAAFRKRFYDEYGSNPGYGASQGYEAFKLFVDAAERSKSVNPVVVATTLRTNHWKGLFGDFSFTDNGAIMGRKVIIKLLKNGAFETVHEVLPTTRQTAQPTTAQAE
jgi:branched-chain amino acid transport system substrate-binding protein